MNFGGRACGERPSPRCNRNPTTPFERVAEKVRSQSNNVSNDANADANANSNADVSRHWALPLICRFKKMDKSERLKRRIDIAERSLARAKKAAEHAVKQRDEQLLRANAADQRKSDADGGSAITQFGAGFAAALRGDDEPDGESEPLGNPLATPPPLASVDDFSSTDLITDRDKLASCMVALAARDQMADQLLAVAPTARSSSTTPSKPRRLPIQLSRSRLPSTRLLARPCCLFAPTAFSSSRPSAARLWSTRRSASSMARLLQ